MLCTFSKSLRPAIVTVIVDFRSTIQKDGGNLAPMPQKKLSCNITKLKTRALKYLVFGLPIQTIFSSLKKSNKLTTLMAIAAVNGIKLAIAVTLLLQQVCILCDQWL
jgi:hypothetical protein